MTYDTLCQLVCAYIMLLIIINRNRFLNVIHEWFMLYSNSASAVSIVNRMKVVAINKGDLTFTLSI